MITATRVRQCWTIARMQLSRVFFSRRSFWVYLLALFPTVPFAGHAIEVKIRQASWGNSATAPAMIDTIREGDTQDEVLKKAGTPIRDVSWDDRRRRGKDNPDVVRHRRRMMYFDGNRRWDLEFEEGLLQSKRGEFLANLSQDQRIYAAIFQQFYLRLLVFFGCLGIFVNLFRGEMLDRTLHFWFLAPAPREVLLTGKYLAGLIAAITVFGAGAILSYSAMLLAQNPTEVAQFWSQQGASHLFWYVASAALACVGYGSVFLASGLLLKNPIVPAIVIAIWESINGVLPAALQKLSVLHYVQALAPVEPPIDADAPLLIRLLASPANPPSAAVAVLGLCAVSALVLWVAARAVRRLEINYGTE